MGEAEIILAILIFMFLLEIVISAIYIPVVATHINAILRFQRIDREKGFELR